MFSLIIAIFTGLMFALLSYLNKKANINSFSKNDILKMPRTYLYMGYLVILNSIFILVFLQLFEIQAVYSNSMFWFLITIVFLFGLYIIRLYKIHSIEIHDSDFIVYSTFGKQRIFQLDGIRSLKINYLTYFITIEDMKGNKAKVYFHLIGFLNLLKQIKIESNVDISKIELLLKI